MMAEACNLGVIGQGSRWERAYWRLMPELIKEDKIIWQASSRIGVGTLGLRNINQNKIGRCVFKLGPHMQCLNVPSNIPVTAARELIVW